MAFSSTIESPGNAPIVMGSVRVSWGTYNAASVTGGDIDTGLQICDFITLQPVKNAVIANQATINETLPGADGSAITIVTNSGDAGVWFAVGPL